VPQEDRPGAAERPRGHDEIQQDWMVLLRMIRAVPTSWSAQNQQDRDDRGIAYGRADRPPAANRKLNPMSTSA
jgi:hypothetical protein